MLSKEKKMSKKALRKEIFALRDSLSDAEIMARSKGIAAQLARCPFTERGPDDYVFSIFSQ